LKGAAGVSERREWLDAARKREGLERVYMLAIWMVEELETEISRLQAENAKYREALEKVATFNSADHRCLPDCDKIAHDALSPQTERT
jgi:hypothetical protein